MPEGTQRCPRTKMVLPLRVWAAEPPLPPQWAHTVEISDIGCRLGGLRTELSPGQTITLQRGKHKASFRVIWSKRLAANENQAGIEAIDPGLNIWALNPPPPQSIDAKAVPVPPSAVSKASSPAGRKPILSPNHRRLSQSLSLAFLILSIALAMVFYYRATQDSGRAALQPLTPAPPTAEDLARLTPKPRPMPVSLTKPLVASASRLHVAEAPTGRVVYPVSPDESITGKVRLQIVVAADGLVKQIHVLSGKQPLAEAAAQAVRLWHYGSLQGTAQSAERETSVTVSFRADAVSLEFPPASSRGSAALSKSD